MGQSPEPLAACPPTFQQAWTFGAEFVFVNRAAALAAQTQELVVTLTGSITWLGGPTPATTVNGVHCGTSGRS
jgi:hypothetical protein